ncbi:restriction endonuclease subunit S [Bradyrhizobium sp. Ce-3]|uniref:restriction endonuclease subunit S n=1 Tax=Bradyrhizobium sp. Ce-3 TaxID=2913970 RepID=UPI001FC7BDA9|nr:restriction endonuclease subunit S [Bradyrhizobium sp. Ce-3]GKQ53190.1 type I restriction endonuclease subunit S [Bradyrhizobium sp. Ce-3]
MTTFSEIRLKFTSGEPLKYGANAAAEFDNPDWPRFVRITDIDDTGGLREETFRSLPPEAAKSYLLREGDVLLARSGATVGKSFIYEKQWGEACYAGYLIRLRVSDEYDARYIYWCLQGSGYWSDIESNLIQATIQNVSAERYSNFRVPSPLLETQRRIARFLDEKIARIDGLIEKKRALLDRLAERRQTLITSAVTKGLNPAVLMKPSGIDWLGEIPAHWNLVPFKWRCRIESGQVDPREPEFANMPLIAPDHIESGTGRLYEVASAAEQGAISGKYLCPPGSILYSKIRPALRKVALYEGACLCSADMYAIDANSHFFREYLFYFLLTDAFTSYAELESLRVAMPKVNREALGAFPLPLPDKGEQREIAIFCKEADHNHRNVTDRVDDSIVKLEDYRMTLITAAVTGRISELA